MARNVMQYSTAASGTVTIQDTGQDVLLIHTNTMALSLSISFPASPQDGQVVSISSTLGITLLSLLAPVGTIIGALSTVPPAGAAGYVFSKAQNKWFKM